MRQLIEENRKIEFVFAVACVQRYHLQKVKLKSVEACD